MNEKKEERKKKYTRINCPLIHTILPSYRTVDCRNEHSLRKRTPQRREQGVFRETIMQIDKARAIKVEKTVVIAALSRNDH